MDFRHFGLLGSDPYAGDDPRQRVLAQSGLLGDEQASEPLRIITKPQPRDAVTNPPYDDKVQASARDANAYGSQVKDPYGYDDLAITLGRLTPGGRLMDAFGAYPTSSKGPLGPSLMQNIRDDNYNGIFRQLSGLWTIPSGDASGVPYPESLIRAWMNMPVKRRP